MSDLTSIFAAATPATTIINSTTPLRMAAVGKMAANKSTLCSSSSDSDIAGVGSNCGSLESCFNVIIDNYLPCPPGQVYQDLTKCPSINGPILIGVTSVSLTTAECVGTILKVYNGSTLITTSPATTASLQTLIVTIPSLTAGSTINAIAEAPIKSVSINNCDSETVSSCSIKQRQLEY